MLSDDTALNIMQQMTEEFCLKMSQQTVPPFLCEAGICTHSPVVKSLISEKKQKKAKLNFTSEIVVRANENWARMFFCD